MATATRRLALDVLRSLARGRQTLGDLLAAPDLEALDPRDRGFLHELVLGTLRHRGFLDYAIEAAAERPKDRIDALVLDALRLGAYQILRLRVPHHAAVGEIVELVKQAQPRATGLANAVLRRLSREGAPELFDAEREPLSWLVTEGSLPAWMAERWVARLGAKAAVARARAFLLPPPVTFRLNPRRADAAALVAEAGVVSHPLAVPDAWEATEGRLVEPAREGLAYLQDLGSQMAARLAAEGRRVLDACAAPGGKSLLIADLDPARTVVALELAPRRLRTLAALARRWGATNVIPVGGDALRLPFGAETFDAVLLDAPCTGTGTLGRNPDLRWKATAADIERQSRRQRLLLREAAQRVRPGGRLVYSACTLEAEETTDVVASLLDARPDFTRLAPPDWAAPFSEPGGLFVRPERDRGDGFFAALLGRR